MMPELTGDEIIAQFLVKAGAPIRRGAGAVYVAEGYYRACGRPMAVCVEDVNDVLADVANVRAGSIPMLIFTEEEPEPHTPYDTLAKKCLRATSASQVPNALYQAWNAMMTGRRGPVIVYTSAVARRDTFSTEIVDPASHMPGGRVFGDSAEIDKAVRLLKSAKRPVILAGGGVIAANACVELKGVAEHIGAAVATTAMGKSALPENHPLYVWHPGSPGPACGNKLTSTADAILAVGCTFAEETRAGGAFAIPPTRLIHVDIDPCEIGRKYPVEVGIVGDAKMVLNNILRKLRDSTKPRLYVSTEYFREIARIKKEWLAAQASQSGEQLTVSALLSEARRYLSDDAYVVTSPGGVREHVLREMRFSVPGTFITTGGRSAPGFALAAGIGAKLARPDRQVMALLDGDEFMRAKRNLSTAAEINAPIVAVATTAQGLADLVRSLGCHLERVERVKDVRNALKRAFNSGRPAVVEAAVTQNV
jgi:acetolactate synthase-1/2/3 large subunit